ncbi:hypothetical protein A2U01_0054085, partial [Trifolium medium]|nr:hypothetical protein [Trifolium medium]
FMFIEVEEQLELLLKVVALL